MTKNHFTREILIGNIDTDMRAEIIGWSEINKKPKEKLNKDFKKFIEYAITAEEKSAIRGFKIGFDLVLILHGLPPKYYSIWPKEN